MDVSWPVNRCLKIIMLGTLIKKKRHFVVLMHDNPSWASFEAWPMHDEAHRINVKDNLKRAPHQLTQGTIY